MGRYQLFRGIKDFSVQTGRIQRCVCMGEGGWWGWGNQNPRPARVETVPERKPHIWVCIAHCHPSFKLGSDRIVIG